MEVVVETGPPALCTIWSENVGFLVSQPIPMATARPLASRQLSAVRRLKYA